MSHPTAARIDTGAGVCFVASAVIHLAVFLLLVWWGRLLPPQIAFQETYYVDIVNLPTADPQAGTPAQKTENSDPAPPPLVPQAMTLPVPVKMSPKITVKPSKPAVPQEAAETESAFADRMEKLKRNREARREEADFEKSLGKVKGASSSKAGMPGASGVSAGSSYADFIKSRLEDALKVTSSYSSKSPEVFVRLTITAEGKLARMKIERSSGDAIFEMAVRRAVDLASEKFVAPPNRTVFENGFVFKPKGIASGSSRK
ncbi:MAG TPA: TonB family protein [Desulfuromonadales bacterium]|nr:TonB family protein [Desulfuromonadales bacterium]